MSKNLVIVESPAKAKTIGQFLGKDFTVKSSFGHVRDLPKKGMSVDIEHDFKPAYEVSPDKKKTVSELKADVPPTAPVRVTIPPVPPVSVRVVPPLIVLEKLILAPAAVPPPFVLSNVGVVVIVTGPVIPIVPPAVVAFPPILIALVPV